MQRETDWTRVTGGACAALLGAVVIYMATGYGIGTPARMQPGYFPMLAGALALGAGAVLLVSGLRHRGVPSRMIGFNLRAAALTFAGVAAFALLVRFGLLPAVIASTALAALGDPANRLRDVALLAVGAVLFVWLVFIMALGLPLDMIRN